MNKTANKQKLEAATKMDFETAFKELSDIDIPLTEGLKPQRDDFNNHPFQAMPKTDCLLEDYYDVTDEDGLNQAHEARKDDIASAKLAKIERIVDLDAKSVDDLQPSYVGKIIIQCPRCMQLFYKKLEDIQRSDVDPAICNVNEPCPNCGQTSGFNLVGKVAPDTSNQEPVPAKQPKEQSTEEDDSLNQDFDEPAEDQDNSESNEEQSSEENSTEDQSNEGNDLNLTPAENTEENQEEKPEEEANEALNRKSLNEMTSAEAANELADIETKKDEAEKKLLDAPSIEDAPIAKEESLDTKSEFPEETDDLEEKFKKFRAEKEASKKKLEEDSLDKAFDEVTGNSKLDDDISDSEAEADLADITESAKLDEDGFLHRLGSKIDKAMTTPSKMLDQIKVASPDFKSILVSTEGKNVRSYPLNTFNLKNREKDITQTARNSGKKVYVYLSKVKPVNAEAPADLPDRSAIENASLIGISDEDGKFDDSYLKDLYNSSNAYNKTHSKDKLGLTDIDTKKDKPTNNKGNSNDDSSTDKDPVKTGNSSTQDKGTESEPTTNQTNPIKDIEPVNSTDSNGKQSSTVTTKIEPSQQSNKAVTFKINGKTITRNLSDKTVQAKGLDTRDKSVNYVKGKVARALGKDIANAITIESLTDLDEASLSNHINSYLKEVYSNVNNFNITDCSIDNNKLFVEGLITFNSGKTRDTKFTFKRLFSKDNTLKLKGYNESLTGSKDVAYILSGKVDNNNLITEGLSYGYKINNNNIDGRN